MQACICSVLPCPPLLACLLAHQDACLPTADGLAVLIGIRQQLARQVADTALVTWALVRPGSSTMGLGFSSRWWT